MQIGNFTPDDVRWTHAGVSDVIKSNTIARDIPRGRGNHILEHWGRRGLVKMEYSEDPGYKEKKIRESMEQYEKFWIFQIQNFNEDNENRKNEGHMYNRPSKELKLKSDEFGIVLIGPWKIVKKQTEESNKGRSSNSEVAELRNQVSELSALVGQLIRSQNADVQMKEKFDEAASEGNVSEGNPADPESTEPEDDDVSINWTDTAEVKELIRKIKYKNKDNLEDFIRKWITVFTDDDIPPDVLIELTDKYQKTFGKDLNIDSFID